MGVVVDIENARQRRRVLEQRRNEKGRFVTDKTPEGILALIKRCAEEAHARFPQRCRDVLRCTQTVWWQASRALEPELGAISRPHVYVKRFQKLTGDRFLSWPDLLRLAFNEGKDFGRVLGGLTADDERIVTVAAAVMSVLRVAHHLGRPPRNVLDYEAGRHQLLSDDRFRSRGTEHLDRVLIPGELLVATFGSFEAVLELAQLPTSEQPPPAAGLSIPDAIAYFYAQTGVLPKKNTLDARMASDRISLASPKGKDWKNEWVSEGLERIAAFPQLPPPPPYGTEPDGEWIPIEIDLGPLPPRRGRDYELLPILRSVERYVIWLEGRPSRDRAYREFLHADEEAIDFKAVRRIGPLAELVEFVSRPGWEQQLDGFIDPRVLTPEAAAVGRRGRRRKLAEKHDPQQVLAILEAAGGEMQARDIAAQLGWTIQKVRNRLALLCETGLVERTEAHARSKRQAYRLPKVENQS